uniref:Uncharacterized protein n=1 Tax=Anguilla anguilla TaxID=7936 RepID=A0A0E9Q9K4_ANGAN
MQDASYFCKGQGNISIPKYLG